MEKPYIREPHISTIYHSTSPPDCCIIVDTERILAQKTALQLNSSLLTSGEVAYNKESELIEIELLPEFSEYFHLVSDIVNSFYTGNLDVVGENIKTVYKFAKCYGVQWIVDYVRPMFGEYIKKDEGCERFVEIFKCAQSMWCTDLSDTCCELLDSELFDKISTPDVLSEFDFFSIKSIASSDKLIIPEKDIFDLVVDWLKISSSRCHNFGNILESIRYHLIERDYLSGVVFDFVLDQPNLPDASRKAILKKVNDSMKQVPVGNTRRKLTESTSSSESLRSVVRTFSPENDECLRKIALWMSGKRNDGDESTRITPEELKTVIRDKFKFMVDNDRAMLIDCLCTYRCELTDIGRFPTLYADLLPLHDLYPTFRLILFVMEGCTESVRNYDQRLYDIPWDLISFQTMSAIVTNSTILDHLLQFDCNRELKKKRYFRSTYYSVYSERFEGCGQVELIMLWSLANPLQQDKIKQLMDTVCFRNIPQVYTEQILLPSVQTIFPDITELTCTHNDKHQGHDTVFDLMDMKIERLPPKIYFLEALDHEFGGEKLFYELNFSLQTRFMTLKSHGNRKGSWYYSSSHSKDHSFILFDANKPHLPKYPLFVRDSNFSTIESFTKCSDNGCFMFYKRSDE